MAGLWGLLAVVLGVGGWFWWVDRRYAAAGQFDSIFFISRGAFRLSLRCYDPRQPNGETVYLQHGLSANAASFDVGCQPSLAIYLRDRGYRVYCGNLRAKGESTGQPLRWSSADFGFDDLLEDLNTLLAYIGQRDAGAKPHFIGHSLGGILGYCYAMTHPGRPFRSLTTIGSALDYRAGASAYAPLTKLIPLAKNLPWMPVPIISKLLISLTRFAPAIRMNFHRPNVDDETVKRIMASVAEFESVRLMIQLADLFSPKGLTSTDGRTRYSKELERVTVPTLAIAGAADVQCSPQAVEATLLAIGSSARRYRCFGRAYGQKEDYGHFDLLCGKQAATDIFPLIAEWIAAHADSTDAQQQ